jgi:xanthine dehydrogenase accessory factor
MKGGIGMPCGGEMEIFVESVQHKPTLLIIGGGHTAKCLSKLGTITGYSVIVLDQLADRESFPDVDKVISESLEEGFSKIKITPQTYIVVVTRHEYDEQALKAVINSQAAYIGMIGSKKRADIVFQALRGKGIAEGKIKSVHSPVGLNIEAETPEEIAVSIIAEIIKVRRGDTGDSLTSKR